MPDWNLPDGARFVLSERVQVAGVTRAVLDGAGCRLSREGRLNAGRPCNVYTRRVSFGTLNVALYGEAGHDSGGRAKVTRSRPAFFDSYSAMSAALSRLTPSGP